ncbi:Crotonyl-CoA reductase [Tritonibacter multivorans]|uniref:Crotonyl-CoA reductase n=1 Tax=Tritonibacter multivorans TaxID=928856 RepID=A0A0P1GCY0_9RHOB|nr:zinc-binding dehydrogenase [Tritonibacter multivorans]MDA7419904.1 zinc-binding dehydrogenase [Tritonibacter multivorans]CUH79288.1 Crotonyl-CoA reductase [Tritonibacter multivorans]SFC12337.1 alcohol dehydrogenase [Tritonibacter multivorans]
MTLPEVMSGVYLLGHGGPEMLAWREDIPVPQPGPGEVLVKVAAAGVNNTDINTRIGWYAPEITSATDGVDQEVETGGWGGALPFPLIQGGDLCGHIVARGPGAARLPLGARVTCPNGNPRPVPGAPLAISVIGSEFNGAFAQYCLMLESDLRDVSASPLSDIEIAAIPCAFGTAEGLLSRADLAAGQHVLITGASGGVGLAAVELAALRGAHVTALSSASKAEAVRGQGADDVLDRAAKLPRDAYDVVIDVVGGDGWPDLIRAVKPGGHYAVAGAIAGPMVTADLREIYLRDITLHGCTYQAPAIFDRLVGMINAGRLKPLISRTYPMQDIARAQADFAEKSLPGKLVLLPPE